MTKIIFIVCLCLGYSVFAEEQTLNFDALLNTQNLLKDPKLVESQALGTSAAKKADQAAGYTTMGNPTFKKEIYNITADLLPWLIEKTQGDPAKMIEILSEAQRNPASLKALYDSMPATEKAKIKMLSNQLEDLRGKEKRP
jgi:hypothetical protein